MKMGHYACDMHPEWFGETDREKGLYEKFTVTRNDGSSAAGKKHHNCRYFVLDLDHDPHAVAALKAYAKSCKDSNPQLSKDLKKLIKGAA